MGMSNLVPVVPVLLALAGAGAAQVQGPLPRRVSLVPEFQKLGLTPRAQADRDTCSLFAVTALADFEHARQSSRPQARLSEEFLVWAANEAAGLKGDQAMFYEAVHGLNVLGTCAAEHMAYQTTSDADRKPSEKAIADARRLAGRWKPEWIRHWDVKRPLGNDELQAIKKALAAGHPVACGLRWPKALRGQAMLEVPPPAEVFDGHSIALVGYEDDPRKPGGGTFQFRNSFGPGWGAAGYGVMSYGYVRAYANDALWLRLGPPGSELPAERFEAETMTVLAAQKCDTSRQGTGPWGGPLWSRGEHLFCRAAQGGFVELGFEVKKAGRYRVRVLATAASDYGTLRASVDGTKPAGDFDLYAGRVCPSGPLELGMHTLAAGKHRVRFIVAGKNAVSTNTFFGIDAVDLLTAQ